MVFNMLIKDLSEEEYLGEERKLHGAEERMGINYFGSIPLLSDPWRDLIGGSGVKKKGGRKE